jgi:putative FmdB family regulatory protein
MPIYGYICLECVKHEERNVKIDDRDEQFCKNGHRLRRTFDFTGMVFSETANGGMK